MPSPEINIVLLEERTREGWAGAAELECPKCHEKTVWRVFTTMTGRAVSLYQAIGRYTTTRRTVKP